MRSACGCFISLRRSPDEDSQAGEETKMCLMRIEKRFTAKEKEIIGWKVFRIGSSPDEFLHDIFSTCPLRVGVSYIAHEVSVVINPEVLYWVYSGVYTSGFHVFASKKDAKLYEKRKTICERYRLKEVNWVYPSTYVVRKVKLEDVRILGKQMIHGAGRLCLADVYVGQVMTIVECLFGG